MTVLAHNVLTVNLVFSTLIFWLIARIYLVPKLQSLEPRDILVPILLLHATRHLGLMFMATGATYPGLPSSFAHPAALGDLAAALLALLALPAVLRGARTARLLVWIFNLEGSIDLVAAITLATLYDAAPFMGAAYWIPALWVPALLVTHYITFKLLLKPWRRLAPRAH
ncbi:MAG: hypothetical protein AB1762_14845 [Gemmatimonadota bacterium]